MVLWLGIAVIPCAIGGTLLAIAPALYKGSAIWVSWEAIGAYILFLFTVFCLAAAVRATSANSGCHAPPRPRLTMIVWRPRS